MIASTAVMQSEESALVSTATDTSTRPLWRLFGRLAERVPHAPLGAFPSPVMPLPALGRSALFVKRDDVCNPIYGGNKVRTLEVLFARALALGKTSITAVGAFGSNHAVATCLLAPRVGLRPRVIAFPQPPSDTAAENLRVVLGQVSPLIVPHWSLLPWAMLRYRRRHPEALLMPPGGACPEGALGYVSAALELAEQVRDGQLPQPERIVLPVGSTCTTAGLLVGLRLAQYQNIAFTRQVPLVHAVRVTPWPITSPARIIALARRTSRLLVALTGDPSLGCDANTLREGLVVDGRFLGGGYGRPTAAGARARELLGEFGRTLDSTYSEKAAAGLVRLSRDHEGPLLLWATKSSAPLPEVPPETVGAAPARVKRWLRASE